MSTQKCHVQRLQLAALSATIAFEIHEGTDGWVQALPDGEFASVDGRPADVPSGKWLMDDVAFAAMKAYTPHQVGDIVIDYEHQTLNKEKNGMPAPAAGWFNIKEVAYRPGKGLFIKPRFTDKALAYLNGGEYKYFSLVFGYDKTTGRPQYIHSAALANRPGVDGMLPLAELSARLNAEGSGLLAQLNAQVTNQPNPSAEDNTVEQLLKKLLAKLGITVEDLNAMPEEQATAALTALTALVDKASQTDGLKTQLAALSADAGKGQTVDLSQYVPVATVNALREQLATLTAENGVLTVEQTVKAAIDEGKAFACEQEYLVALGKQSLTALTANLDARKPLAALSAKQTTTVDVPNKDKDNKLAALTAEDISVAEQMGLSLEAMADAKKAQR